MSELDLPEPSNWGKVRNRLLWVSVSAGAFLVYFIVRGILAGLRGNYLTTFLVLGFSSFGILMMAALVLAAVGKAQARTGLPRPQLTRGV